MAGADEGQAFAQPLALLADVGGTNARFGLWWSSSAGVEHAMTMQVADHPNLADAIETYLQKTAQVLHRTAPLRPSQVGMAVAMPLDGDRVALTNGPWSFSRRELAQRLGVPPLTLLNDFEALALSLPHLAPAQLKPWPGSPSIGVDDPERPMLAVVGPGTGLGVAGCLRTASGWQALPAEGGHASLAPADAFEAEVLKAVWPTYEHVSAERLISGTGLPLLHQAVSQVMGFAKPPTLDAQAIVSQGVQSSDAACSRTVDTFCAMLGGFAGNVALTLGARGGVFIGGGIVPRLGAKFFASKFRERFEAKGRYRPYLQRIGTALIVDTLAALHGVAAAMNLKR